MKYLAFVFTHSHLVPFPSPSRSLYFNMNPIVYIIDLLLASFHFDFAGVVIPGLVKVYVSLGCY